MPYVDAYGAKLYFEESGHGYPIIFIHEFASVIRGWESQLRHFSRGYRCVAYNARGYLFRTINAVMAAPLATEMGLGADDLGLLTSVYFLTFAAAQIPIGILLDRYGPRRVQSVLLVIAAGGVARGFWGGVFFFFLFVW